MARLPQKTNQLIIVHKRTKITNMDLLIYPGQLKQVTGTQCNESAQQSLITYTKQCTLTGYEFAMIEMFDLHSRQSENSS